MIDKDVEEYFETNRSIHTKILKEITLNEILLQEWIVPNIELFITPPIIDQNFKNLTNNEHKH